MYVCICVCVYKILILYRLSQGVHRVIPMLLVHLVADFISDIVKSLETYLHVLWQLINVPKIPSVIKIREGIRE